MNGTSWLERGRASYAGRAWADAAAALARADREAPLPAEDLELLATSTYMLGRVDEALRLLERTYEAYLDAGEPRRAARSAVYLGINLALGGDVGAATGWFGRAQRIVEQEGDCAERGYLELPIALRHEARFDPEAACAAAAGAAAIGQRFGDRDLCAMAMHVQGRALIKLGRLGEGLALLDEAMLDATAGGLSPIVTGVVYCGVIAGCEEAFEVRRAREWTDALSRWCEQQPQLVAFSGRCHAHRAEIMQLHGAWPEALEEAQRARERAERAQNRAAAAQALYQEGELRRLQGDLAGAERAYREASDRGREPQPGLALLRLAQGEEEAAAAAIRRALAETGDPLARARLLPAAVEIMLAAGEGAEAKSACAELAEIAGRFESAMLRARVEHVRGSVELAEGDPRAALVSLRRASQAWQELDAPYESARTRVLLGRACRELGDADGAGLELEAAQAVFERLGAAPDLARVASQSDRPEPDAHGLTARELEVLRLVAAGKSNREIAAELVLSEHTVARHLQNIFVKLRVSSRTAATAFAFEHDLV